MTRRLQPGPGGFRELLRMVSGDAPAETTPPRAVQTIAKCVRRRGRVTGGLRPGELEQFHADLATLGLPRQRQYESRSTFRNLCLLAGATEFHVNLITHPKPRQASDSYTRLEMQWPKMCEAVLHLDPAAWSRVGSSPREVTIEGDGYGTETKTPCKWTCLQGAQVVTRTGIESGFSPVISSRYVSSESDEKSSTEPSDASGRVATSPQASDVQSNPPPLPAPSPDLFLTAGAVVAEWAARRQETRSRVEEILRRAVEQAAALREGAP